MQFTSFGFRLQSNQYVYSSLVNWLAGELLNYILRSLQFKNINIKCCNMKSNTKTNYIINHLFVNVKVIVDIFYLIDRPRQIINK